MSSEEGYLDKLLYSTIRDQISWPRFGVELIVRRCADLGIILTRSQIVKLKRDLEGENLEKLLIQLDNEQEQQLKLAQGEDSNTIDLSIGNLDDLSMHLEEAIAQAVPDVLQSFSEMLLDEWKQHANEVLAEQRSERARFNESAYNIWGEAINWLDVLVGVCLEEGARFNELFREEAAQTDDFVFDALTRLHARGCQIGFEILALLKNGFADGAHARWRTLHELAVVAMFLAEHGRTVAQRYLEHSGIANYWEAKAYQRHCNALGYPPLSKEEVQQISTLRDSLIKKYGKDFDQDYGWAGSALSGKRSTFADLEKSVSLDHLRPFYKLANINVHAGSKGGYFRLGSPPQNDNLLLAGSSLFGLADPGQNTAISIHQLTVALLLSRPNLDRVAFAQAIQMLLDEVLMAFIKAHEELENRSAA
jgi:hypothetical protein